MACDQIAIANARQPFETQHTHAATSPISPNTVLSGQPIAFSDVFTDEQPLPGLVEV